MSPGYLGAPAGQRPATSSDGAAQLRQLASLAGRETSRVDENVVAISRILDHMPRLGKGSDIEGATMAR